MSGIAPLDDPAGISPTFAYTVFGIVDVVLLLAEHMAGVDPERRRVLAGLLRAVQRLEAESTPAAFIAARQAMSRAILAVLEAPLGAPRGREHLTLINGGLAARERGASEETKR